MAVSGRKTARRVLATAVMLATSLHHAMASAQSATAPAAGTPPRIGLALSGGGARGIAHVGVLKVLDEMRIPIHCVTGTSMGAIVGGTFASGTPPKRLEELVLAADWNGMFRDQPPRDEISMRRKADDYRNYFSPEIGTSSGKAALGTWNSTALANTPSKCAAGRSRSTKSCCHTVQPL